MDVSLLTKPRTWEDHSYILSPIQYQNWQALQVFSLFRFILASTFVIVTKFNLGLNFVSEDDKFWFYTIAQAYLGISVLCLIGCVIKKIDYDLQVNVPIFFDILALILLSHMAGGLHNGLILLLPVIIAAHSLLAPTLFALCGAALASSAILTEQVYTHLTYSKIPTAFMQAGLLGLCIFVISLIASWLKHRMQSMHQLAYERGIQLASALQLNAHVVAYMQEGVLVLDEHNNIQLINNAALKLLKLDKQPTIQRLTDLPLRFQKAFFQFYEKGDRDTFQIHDHSPDIRLSMIHLNDEENTFLGLVVFLHDVSKENQQAQQMKLALLGSLAANIAHEIRNPLSSVSHSAQLMVESTHLDEQDKRLLQIIKDNCDRMNVVIKNVLMLSKKQASHPERINLNFYIAWFLETFKPQGLHDVNIDFEASPHPLYVYIDTSQLYQMLVNLCENGLRYSMRHQKAASLIIRVEPQHTHQHAAIHIIDYGSGIEPHHLKRLYEPFFTTEKYGSGLGLYITKELCQMNGGQIHYELASTGGSDFILLLPLHQETLHYGST